MNSKRSKFFVVLIIQLFLLISFASGMQNEKEETEKLWTALNAANAMEERLRESAMSGDLRVVKHFIEQKQVNPRAGNCLGWTALHLAAGKGKLNVVRYLVEKRKINLLLKDDDELTALHFATEGKHFKIIKYFIKKIEQNSNKHGFTNKEELINFMVNFIKSKELCWSSTYETHEATNCW